MWNEREWAEWMRMGVENKNTTHAPTWKTTPKEDERVDAKRKLESIEIDTVVADFSRILEGTMPFDITREL